MNSVRRLLPFFLLLLAHTTYASAPWVQDNRVLSCSPDTLHVGDTLRLTLGLQHGSELSISRKSDRTTFFLVVGTPPSGIYQLMTTEQFKRTSTVEINTNLRAAPWPAGSRAEEPVFDRSGEYDIFVSDNLESEQGGYYCRVRFVAECPPELAKLGTCQPTPLMEKYDTGPGTGIDDVFWTGYAVEGLKDSPINFTKVEASWTVPNETCPLTTADKMSSVSYWVGLGGTVANVGLEQLGIITECTVAGLPIHWIAWEIIIEKKERPGPQIDYFFPISSNDRIEASVEGLGNGKYRLTLHNKTTNRTWQDTKEGSKEPASVQTAECIVESPKPPLSNFGKFTFEGCRANGKSLLTYPRLLKFIMKNGKAIMAEPAEINSNSNFTIWKHE